MLFRAFIVCLLTWAASLSAQELPPRPETFLLDDSRIFSEAQKAQLQDQLTAFHQKTGVELYVATFTFVQTSSIIDQVKLLADAWGTRAPTMVLGYSRGEDACFVFPSADLWRKYPASEVVAVLGKTAEAYSAKTPADVRLISSTETLIDNFLPMDAERVLRERPFPPENKPIALILGGIVAFLAIVAWIIANRVQASSRFQAEKYYFPEVKVGTRLGATFGGGTLVERKVPKKDR